MNKIHLNIGLLIIFYFASAYPQKASNDTIFVASWNLENLFDIVDDPGKNDQEFLPDGSKNWTNERLDEKLKNLAKVIHSMNNNNGPDILGVCEVEHESLLKTMISKYLSGLNYNTAYYESPDERGIDNGLIYNSNKFTLAGIVPDTIHLENGDKTRLILNAKLVEKESNDTLRIFVNHWPSRIGGVKKSEPNRVTAASVLSQKVNNYFSRDKGSNIIIVGDFNDEPSDKSLSQITGAQPYECSMDLSNYSLFNLAYKSFNEGEGSYKYKDNWDMLDQIIISQNLISGKIKYVCSSFKVYKPYFLLTHSGKYEGTPFPTYGGKRYLGGYSDHFPVVAKFTIDKN